MLQLKVPFSHNEAEVLIHCLSQLEARSNNAVAKNSSGGHQRNITALHSAKQKVNSNVFDDFYHDEIIHMVYALDNLSRECSSKLTENIPLSAAEELSDTLRTAATARCKLRRAVIAD